MFLKLSVFVFIIHVSVQQMGNQDWDLAVTINDQIELLSANGTLLGATLSFSRLKALTFDNVRHQFIASDMNEENDTIISIPLNEEGNNNIPIVEDLPDDIQGLAIDPLTDILYWTDPKHKSINYVPLNKPYESYKVFMKFEDVEPQDLAIDSCRRYIYFTNSWSDRPSINRINLDTKEHQVLVDSDLHTPVGIAIDYVAEKLYWSDSGPGIYFSIESANLEGKERSIVISDTHQHPFGLAVDSQFIYWTDINNNALWRREKNYGSNENRIYKLKHFDERPQGIIAKHLGFAGTPDCENVMRLISEYNESTTEYYQQPEAPANVTGFCLNNGHEIEDGACECRRGYKGRYCEVSLCYNYCVHGRCGFTKQGYPKCYCNTGFSGNRCESNICDTYCLNNGTCRHVSSEIWGAKCHCREGYFGDRCEVNIEKICDKFCKNDADIPEQFHNFLCICDGKNSIGMTTVNITDMPKAETVHISAATIGEHFKDPTFLILSACMLVSMSVTVILMTFVCKMKKKRPRVNKRIIVNKNVTPLTYRPPQSTTQECEITIENCCNMNVCETPCFEPPILRRKNPKDEKKKLLTNMENPDELC